MIYGQTQSKLRGILKLAIAMVCLLGIHRGIEWGNSTIGVKLKTWMIEPVFDLDPSAKCNVDIIFNY